MLALAALARGKAVLVSRGELVAIGGSFKIPEILEASGARLLEVGTTNRTTAEDYRRACTPEVAMILTVHPSNYEIRGYTRSPSAGELAALARDAGIPWVHDQGTGCVVALDQFGVAGEPTVAECLAGGADLVTFSGDKLLSGPQAGLLVGRADLVGRAAAHPIARAVRPDKLTLAALAATLRGWKTGAWKSFPVYRAAAAPVDELERRGAAILEEAGSAVSGEIVASEATFGGGTSPEKLFASRALAVSAGALATDEIAKRLRAREPPVVARVERGRVLLDLRSILPEEDAIVARSLASSRGRRRPARPGPQARPECDNYRMRSRALRLTAFCGLALSLLAARSAGCRAKSGPNSRPPAAVTPATRHGGWITPLLTAPPPRPTPTLWKGVTRVPDLPE